MAVVGPVFAPDKMFLTTGRDFKWAYQLVDEQNVPTAFPAGRLYFELATTPVTVWEFAVSGSYASLKIEHEKADLIPDRTRWQLVFLPSGEPAGGDPVALGTVKRQR